jgi:type I restriction enzyme M protein
METSASFEARSAPSSYPTASGDEELRSEIYDELGEPLFENFAGVLAKLEELIGDGGAIEADEDEEGPAHKGLSEKKREDSSMAKPGNAVGLVETATALRRELGDELYEDHNIFRDRVAAAFDKLKIKISATDLKTIMRAVSWRVETAPPVIAKIHKIGKTQADPLHGFYEADVNGSSVVIEYESDSDLHDSEQVLSLNQGTSKHSFVVKSYPLRLMPG